MSEFLENSYAPINRSSYRLAGEATEAYEGARRAVARLVNAPSADEVVFTKNATESMNLIARSWGVANLREGDVVVLTHMEHHANIVPWQMLRDELRHRDPLGAAHRPTASSISPTSTDCSTAPRCSRSRR